MQIGNTGVHYVTSDDEPARDTRRRRTIIHTYPRAYGGRRVVERMNRCE
jgi:hypothetical protein